MAIDDDYTRQRMRSSSALSWNAFTFIQTYTRPNDNITYSAGDAISDSTTAPTQLSLDLKKDFEAYQGCTIEITNVALKWASPDPSPIVGVLISGRQLVVGNDNAPYAPTLLDCLDPSTYVIKLPASSATFAGQIQQNDNLSIITQLAQGKLYATLWVEGTRAGVANDVIGLVIQGKIT